ncbi:unnamed protein product [Pleuronectes platessa]|uniref:Uncharacterized protein n=1 Tax=Pleuronectes platessa TaxID=8262 RepID=A0A9N7VS90_PLEPL|nr:unnamed protein product [Pleuronectes platessa]
MERCRKEKGRNKIEESRSLSTGCVSMQSSKHRVPRITQGDLFVGPARDLQPTPTYIDSKSQTSTTYVLAAHSSLLLLLRLLLLLLTPPSTQDPINDTGPGKRERRAGDRHELWHEMQKRSPSDVHTRVRAHRRLSLPAKSTVWLTPGVPRRTRGSCS